MTIKHLRNACEGYFQHAGHALYYAGQLALAALAALIHAFVPFWFENTASNIIWRLNVKIQARKIVAANRINPPQKRYLDGEFFEIR